MKIFNTLISFRQLDDCIDPLTDSKNPGLEDQVFNVKIKCKGTSLLVTGQNYIQKVLKRRNGPKPNKIVCI